ncbi:MAG: serine hydrolase domain-containing protein [Henriciella sp.]|nr:serine hydrolase domain-containing protein [Henriciella sp.]
MNRSITISAPAAIAAVLLAACGSPDSASAPEAGVEVETSVATSDGAELAAKIEAVETGLLTPVLVEGAPQKAWTLADRMALYTTPAVSIAVIENGEIAWAKTYGVADTETNAAANTDTVFQAASVSKPVAGAATMTLVDQGQLQLDAPVNDKLTAWSVPDNEFTVEQSVTLRHLMTHSAGLSVSGFPGYTDGADIPTAVQILNGEAPANTPAVEVVRDPGMESHYSGGGLTVMQQLASDVSGKRFADLATENLFDPVGMTRSTFVQPLSGDWTENAARAHFGVAAQPMPGLGNIYPELAAAGLWTTPTDLARFLLNVTEAAKGEEGRMLSVSSAREMLTPQIDGWGLTFRVDDEADGISIGHSGANYGFRSQMFAYTDGRGGAVIMTNSDKGDRLISEILAAISSVYGWAYGAPETRSAVAISEETASAMVGNYQFEWPGFGIFTINISLEDDGPWMDHANFFPRSKIFASSETTFFLDNGMTFEMDTVSTDAAPEIKFQYRTATRFSSD